MSSEETPSYDNFVLNQADLDAIAAARAEGDDVWESKRLKDLRGRIKAHHLIIQGEQCCYCKRNLKGEFTFVLDIEHILPKGRFPRLMFDITNLSVSCKRCNMNVKGQRVDFVVDLLSAEVDHRHSHLYRFIHPNLDTYFAHLSHMECHVNGCKMVKYLVVGGSAKGRYTYEYFRLSELEVNSFDRAQGLDVEPPNELVEELRLKVVTLLGST